jgi:hypothetical protein
VILAKTEEKEWMENLEHLDSQAIEENLAKTEFPEFRVSPEKRDQQDYPDPQACRVTKDLQESRVIR